MPRIQKFSDQITDFMDDNQMMRECIRKFDEDISLKSSKSEVELMKTLLQKTFITFQEWDAIETSVEK